MHRAVSGLGLQNPREGQGQGAGPNGVKHRKKETVIMAFGINLNSSSGDIRAIIKYDARTGRIQRMDREDGVTIPTDITTNFTALFDFENAEKGWLFFAAT